MRRHLAGLGCAGLLAALAATTPALATPEEDAKITGRVEPRIVDLHVAGGTRWSPENRFVVGWRLELPKGVSRDAILGVRYEIGPDLDRARKEWLPGPQEVDSNVRIPLPAGSQSLPPGTYELRIWAHGTVQGPVEKALLRYDDQPPAVAKPILPAGWIRGDAEPVLRIAHPAGPQPVSGIRGYAVAVRPGSAAPPCAGPDSCAVEETDLGDGIDDDLLGLGRLPEGLNTISVVAVSNSGLRSPQAETAVARVDPTFPDLRLAGAGGGWSDRPVRVVATATDVLSGMTAAGPEGPRTSISVDGGPPTISPGGEVTAIVAGSGIHSVLAGARDAAGNVRGEGGGAPPLGGEVRIDETAPAVAFSRNRDPGEPELIEATVADALSGPAAERGSIGVRPLGSGQAFEPLPTSDRNGRLLARWSSDEYPKGSYEFRVTGYDAAGNAASSGLRADGERMVLANPVKVPAEVRFGFGGERLAWQRCVRVGEGRRCHREVVEAFARRPLRRVVPYGRGVQVAGRLVSVSGAPLAGYPVELVERFDPGATMPPRLTTVSTGPGGLFLARLGPGPSRQVEARFGGSRLLARAVSGELRLGVRSAVRLRASTARARIGGAPVVFGGQVPHLGAAIPDYGRPIQFQFRLAGEPWTEFRTVQTDAQGRFRFPYSFSDDDSRGIRFLFRAYAPPQPGWPYEPVASRPVAVTGY